MNTYFLLANKLDGVMRDIRTNINYPSDLIILDDHYEFYERLKNLTENDFFGCYVSRTVYENIKKNYGIKNFHKHCLKCHHLHDVTYNCNKFVIEEMITSVKHKTRQVLKQSGKNAVINMQKIGYLPILLKIDSEIINIDEYINNYLSSNDLSTHAHIIVIRENDYDVFWVKRSQEKRSISHT